MADLTEKWRPKTLDQVVGQEKVLSTIRNIIDSQGLIGQKFYLVGASGVGKTSTARILADMVQPYFDRAEFDAKDVRRDLIREWEEKLESVPIGCKGRAFVINEAHNLSHDITERLLTFLEKPLFVKHGFIVFTTSEKCLFGNPFGDRVDEFEFAADEAVTLAFALRCREIAQIERLDGQPLEAYVKLVRNHHHSMRKCLRIIGRGEFKA